MDDWNIGSGHTLLGSQDVKVVEGGDETVVVVLLGNDDVTAASRTVAQYHRQISMGWETMSSEGERRAGDSPGGAAVSRLTIMSLDDGGGLGRGDKTGSQGGEDDYVEGSHSLDGCGTR